MAGTVGNVSDNSFQEEVLGSELPVLVDFWAPWCRPCKAIAPLLEEVAGEYEGKIRILKMNVDENPKTPAEYKVQGIPNLVFFKNGEKVERLIGNVPRDQLVEVINKIV